MQSASPNRIAFDLERVMRTTYRIDDFQESYFVLDSIDDLLALADIKFSPLYARLDDGIRFAPGQLQAQDRVLHHGDCSYHRAQAQQA